MELGIVADDNTGATDAAGMLTECGARTLLICGAMPSNAEFEAYDAVVIGTQSRSIDPQSAYRRVAEVVRLFLSAGARKIQLKYCSTFDSTPAGNIGPSLDAALDALGLDWAVVAPALPGLGRTTYQGYHFVGDQLLSESAMRNHPLNPMTDGNIVRWLKAQTKRTVTLAPLAVVRQGSAALAQFIARRVVQGASYIVVDAIDDGDLAVAAEATATSPFVSGASGITAALARMLFPGRPPLSFADRLARIPRTTAVIAGSTSESSRAQNAMASQNGFHEISIAGPQILLGKVSPQEVAQAAAEHLARGEHVLVSSKVESCADVEQTQKLGAELGLTAIQTGVVIARFLAEVARQLVENPCLGRLIVAGGETSCFVCDSTGISRLEVGLPLDPGVPYCFPLGLSRDLLVVLKSGNFGDKDLYCKVASL
jgi:uncharacterized protein YgbK (DUF1537 family)